MTQSFKVFTPQFHALIIALVKDEVQNYAVQKLQSPMLPDISERAIEQAIVQTLEGYWYHNITPNGFTVPKNLECPEYVEYEFTPSLIGHPIMPTMIPSSFKPLPVKVEYLRNLATRLDEMITESNAAVDEGYDFKEPEELTDHDNFIEPEDPFFDEPTQF